MARDYKSFSSAVKSRFRGMAKLLDYEQLSGVLYVKEREGWYEGFSLQASSYGNDFFYINYGVIVPNLWPPFKDDIDLKAEGYILHNRLHNDHDQGFSNATLDEIVKSAEISFNRYQEQAVPWFHEIRDLSDIAERYFESTHLEEEKLGKHEYGMQLSAANYGLLLRLAGKIEKSLVWLKEAERLMALPVFFTRDGRIVYVREKHSRIIKPEEDEIEQRDSIKKLVTKMENA
jgi:hypothetical protein